MPPLNDDAGDNLDPAEIDDDKIVQSLLGDDDDDDNLPIGDDEKAEVVGTELKVGDRVIADLDGMTPEEIASTLNTFLKQKSDGVARYIEKVGQRKSQMERAVNTLVSRFGNKTEAEEPKGITREEIEAATQERDDIDPDLEPQKYKAAQKKVDTLMMAYSDSRVEALQKQVETLVSQNQNQQILNRIRSAITKQVGDPAAVDRIMAKFSKSVRDPEALLSMLIEQEGGRGTPEARMRNNPDVLRAGAVGSDVARKSRSRLDSMTGHEFATLPPEKQNAVLESGLTASERKSLRMLRGE